LALAGLAVEEIEEMEPQQALRALGHRLLGEFRKRARALAKRGANEAGSHAGLHAGPAGGEIAPDMQLVDALAERFRQWHESGRANAANPRAIAGLLVTAAYGIAAIEAMSGKPIMDEAVDGFAAVIWNGVAPRD
jgi:AcrR family transcriptional regulator